MNYLEMGEEKLRTLIELHGLDDSMFFSLYNNSISKIRELEVWEKFATVLLNQSKLQGDDVYEANLTYFRKINTDVSEACKKDREYNLRSIIDGENA